MTERPHLTMTLWVLHPTAPMSVGLSESVPARSPGLGSLSLYGRRTSFEVGGGGGIQTRSFGSVGGGGEGRAPGLRRGAGLARIGCGAGTASRLLAEAPGARVPLTRPL